jgi:hypothetical protein
MVDYLGWAATAVVVSSYFCKTSNAMRRTQMVGAVMWTTYGAVMHAAPVVVANLLVLCAAAWTAAGSPRTRRDRASEPGPMARARVVPL